MISVLFLKLLLAHFLGDFLLQPTNWVKDKEVKKIRSKYLYYHIAVHVVLLSVLLWGTANYFSIIGLVVVSHYIIDLLKLYFGEKMVQPWAFFIDQIAHLSVLVFVAAFYESWNWNLDILNDPTYMLLSLCLLLTTVVAAIVMKVLISTWKIDDDGVALKNAGKYIGILERLFVFGFVIMNFWEGVGFLLAAKSIFRFGDLTRSKDRKLTEYVLIGTLLSFGMAMACGVLFNKLHQLITG
ncbi:DUF3307 domain-containing protein [Flavobacterium sp. NKUCC04_CG]|uniref:DUF3307 domain-containing protein n=1 Tax=Flavobacterium sp. NKUCC04_CG TaxID=2842121 RepID=UPI001C5B79A9|nr:DUF3307 domain-containing protein [Flavobacterium sp. NKUCC04_CG]MBW3517938.1 DUF3307 domain-containing protein [Flavobacterium sp. NKUCC04_CG]